MKVSATYSGRSHIEGMDEREVLFNIVLNENLVPGIPKMIVPLVLTCIISLSIFFVILGRIHSWLIEFVNKADTKRQ